MHHPYLCALFLICLFISLVDITVAQSIHVVKVGDTGSFYDPQVTTARTGDTVSFQWTGKFHSVTQSSFDNPCTPLVGGFDSSVTGNPGQLLLVPTWNLTITDDTQPIWFFCKVTQPVPHCTNGMVGAINADLTNGNQSFNNFTLNAKLLQNPPQLPFNTTPILSGVGAFATITPLPMHNASNASTIIPTATTTPATSTLLSSLSTSTSPAVQVQQNSSTGLSTGVIGGIAGGVVGLVLLAILLVLLLMSYRRGKRYRREAKAIRHLHSKSDMSQIDRMDLDGAPPEPPFTPSQQIIQLHRSQGSLSVNESLERESATTPSLNIKELAAEIAKNMRQDLNQPDRGGFPPDPATLATVPELDALSSGAGSSRGTDGSARGRQLPRPPQTSQTRVDARADVRSVDTLPAYAPGHAR